MGVDAFPVAYDVRCEFHLNQELTTFCLRCEKKICTQCRNSGHRGHPTALVDDILSHRRQLIDCAVIEMSENHQLKPIASSLKRKRTEMNANKRRDIAKVQTQSKHLKNTIDAIANEVIENIERDYDVAQCFVKEKFRLVKLIKQDTTRFINMTDSFMSNNDKLLFKFQKLLDLNDNLIENRVSDDVNIVKDIFETGEPNETELKALLGKIHISMPLDHDKPTKRSIPLGPPLRPSSRYPLLPDIRLQSAVIWSSEHKPTGNRPYTAAL